MKPKQPFTSGQTSANRQTSAETTTAEDPGPREVERVMEDLTYEHLLDLVDFDRLWQLELVLCEKLFELFENSQLGHLREDQIAERANQMIERAWVRAINDPRRIGSAPWEADDDCELCRMLAQDEKRAAGARS